MNRIVGNQYGAWDWYLDSYDGETSPLALQFYTNLPELKGNLAFVPYFSGKDGKVRVTQDVQRQQMVIFKKTTEAKAINLVKLFNYMVSKEGFYLTELGIEGQHYTINGGRIVLKDLSSDEKAKLGHWNYAWTMKRSYIPIAASQYINGLMHNEFGSSIGIIPPLAYDKAWQEYGTALNSLTSQYVADLIIQRNINFDAVFDEFVKTWNSSGGDKVTAEMNQLYGKK
jgi:hypothetical protein